MKTAQTKLDPKTLTGLKAMAKSQRKTFGALIWDALSEAINRDPDIIKKIQELHKNDKTIYANPNK